MTDTHTRMSQTTHRVLMVRPAVFYSNPETAATNAFQKPEPDDATALAQGEFDAMVGTLRDAGIDVIVAADTTASDTPDAIFPNNWLSTHADGTVVTYPMQPVSRRAERRQDILMSFGQRYGLHVARHIDLSSLEDQQAFLEGTGSLVLDRVHRRAYACYSPRTTHAALDHFCRALDYQAIAFHAAGTDGTPVYHTNVMMCVGRDVIVACLAAIDESDRARVQRAMQADHQLVSISLEQMGAFAGNMLELKTRAGEPVLAMSRTAFESLTDDQRRTLRTSARLLPVAIPTIETAGGSVRCMIAEVFLPQSGDDANKMSSTEHARQ